MHQSAKGCFVTLVQIRPEKKPHEPQAKGSVASSGGVTNAMVS